MLKLIHCADAHLDTPFTGNQAAMRREELRARFAQMIAFAQAKSVDLLLIAGDLFDAPQVSRQTAEFVCEEFAKIPTCKIVIATGNHDPYTETSVWQTLALPDHVFLFTKPQMTRYSFPELQVDVYGYGFDHPQLLASPLAGFRAEGDHTALLCIHGEIGNPLSPKGPISLQDIAHSGVRYAAIGHIHNTEGVKHLEHTAYAYSGSLCARDFGEIGKKGFFYIEIEPDSLRETFVELSGRHYEIETISADGMRSGTEAVEAIRTRIAERGFDEYTALRVVLTGSTTPDFVLTDSDLADNFPDLLKIEADNRTMPIYDADALLQDPGIRGAFFKEMQPLLESGSTEQRKVAALALKAGLRALAGDDPEGIQL